MRRSTSFPGQFSFDVFRERLQFVRFESRRSETIRLTAVCEKVQIGHDPICIAWFAKGRLALFAQPTDQLKWR